MANELLTLAAPIISALLGPVKTALTTAETDPQGALTALSGLADSTLTDLPEIKDVAIQEGATLLLGLFNKLEADLAGTTAAAPTVAA